MTAAEVTDTGEEFLRWVNKDTDEVLSTNRVFLTILEDSVALVAEYVTVHI